MTPYLDGGLRGIFESLVSRDIKNDILGCCTLFEKSGARLYYHLATLPSYLTYIDLSNTGTSLEQVRQVHWHPLKFGNRCATPVLRTVDLC